jgi:hypothetical protein
MRRIKAAGIGLDGLQREHFEVLSLRPVVEEILVRIKDGAASYRCAGCRSRITRETNSA